MKATLLQHQKYNYGAGLIEIAIWRVSAPIAPCVHSFKYRLVYIVAGVRVVGYDNERGKGDHKHVEVLEVGYEFKGIAALLSDFLSEVERRLK